MKTKIAVICSAALAVLSLGAGEWGRAPNGEFWNGYARSKYKALGMPDTMPRCL